MLLPPALSLPCSPSAPLSCVPHGNAVSFPLRPPRGHPVLISLLRRIPLAPAAHPLLVSSLSPWPSLRRSPLSPSLLTFDFFPRQPSSVSSVVLPCAVFFLHPFSASPRGRPAASPFLPPSQALLPPSSGGPLQPLAPPLALLPPAPAADIAHKYKDVGDQTGGVVARWSVVGGSAPRGKIPSRPRAVVGDGISRPLFLHLPQQ